MAINIGTQAHEAIKELKDSSHMRRFVEAFGQVALKRLIASVATPVDQRVAATSHAHGIWELWEAVQAAYDGVLPSQIALPELPPTLSEGRNKGRSNAI